MRTGMITAAVLTTLGLAAVPSMVSAAPAPEHRVETRTTTRETRPVEVQRQTRTVERNVTTVVHDEHRDVRVDVRPQRDVRIDEHVVIDRDDHHWDHDRVYIPTPVVSVPLGVYFDNPVGINQVPPVVLSAAEQQSGGAPIVSVDFVHNGIGTFYDVHMSGPYNAIQTLRFGINGGFYGYL